MNVPALRFLEFSKTEKNSPLYRLRFDEVFDFSSGKNIKQNEASPDFTTPCVRYGELYHLYAEVISEVVNKTNLPNCDLYFSKGNEILLPSAGEDPMDIGSASALTIENVAIGRTINILRPKNEGVCSQLFAAYYINFVLRKQIATLARGSSISNVYNSDLKTLYMNCPSLPEQKKIAAFLGAVDAKLAALGQVRAGLQTYKRRLMQKLFAQDLRFTKPDGSAFPDWEEKRLGDVATRSTAKNTNLDYMRVLTNSAVRGVIDQGDYFDKDIANAENLTGYYVLKKGDFVYNSRISTYAPVGPIKRNDLGDGLMSPLYTVFRFKTKDTEFFNVFFNTTVWHKYMKAIANYGARHDRMAITSGDLMDMPLPYPHPDEQRLIADALQAMNAKITAVSDQVTQMEAFKKGLLQQMFV